MLLLLLKWLLLLIGTSLEGERLVLIEVLLVISAILRWLLRIIVREHLIRILMILS